MNTEPETKKYSFSSFSVIIVFVCLAIVGMSLVPMLSVQLNPSRTTSNFGVSFYWNGASAQVIEQEVTSRLEGMFSAIKGLNHISSVSYKGSGYINLGFKEGVNLDAVRFEVATLIRQVHPDLPARVSYPQISASISGNRIESILSYTLNASLSPFFIQKYGEQSILPILSRVPGVSKVDIYGASPYEWIVEFDVEKSDRLGVRGDDIAAGIGDYFRTEFAGKGAFSLPNQRYLSETSLLLQSRQADSVDWRKIPIKKVGGRLISLEDVASVKYREQSPNSYYRINGLNSINVVIYPEEGGNALQIGENVKAEIERVRAGLPPGYALILSYDATEFLSKEIEKIGLRTAFSLFILLLFVLLVSRQFRYLLIILISITANLLVACIFFYFFKIELQLYSLAGLTISFGIIIDNSIVMIDHLRHNKNKKVFLAIFAATLTTIGALCVIFFLKEEQRLNLIDFAWVIMINLLVSMGVALFLIPALMDKIRLREHRKKVFYKRKRRVLRFTRFYSRVIRFSKRWRWGFILLLILGFGLPVHWLPSELKGEGWWPDTYNMTLGNKWFKEDAKPILEKALGGSMRLFTQDVFEKAYYSEPARTTLYARGTMPEGCTVGQLNEAVMEMENHISQFEEVEMFRTNVHSYSNSNIAITFKPEFENGSFPYFLKSELESHAISHGGMDWAIYGVGQGFSNALYDGYKNSNIRLEGYNYEQLYRYAEVMKDSLLKNERIKEVEIKGSNQWNAKTMHEFTLKFDNESLALHDARPAGFYNFLRDRAYRRQLPPVYINNEAQPVYLLSNSYGSFNIWDFNYRPVKIGEKELKLESFASIEKTKTGNDIHKRNQQYELYVSYDFIGPHQLSQLVREKQIKKMNELLPIGFRAEDSVFRGWNQKEESQYYLILLVIAIIFFICAILLESFLQPLAIIALIPFSFIGLFLTFYLFELNFDQGGFAAFILLCGLSVNAGLFIVNDFNNYKKRRGKQFEMKAYLKAFNHKITPILLTIVSTVIGLIPFIWGGQKEVFWFAFAAGSIGGLIFSILAIFIYLPLFIRFIHQR